MIARGALLQECVFPDGFSLENIDRATAAISCLDLILRNIVTHPCEERFRRVNIKSQTFLGRVSSVIPTASQILTDLCGFVPVDDSRLELGPSASLEPLSRMLECTEMSLLVLGERKKALEDEQEASFVQRALQARQAEAQQRLSLLRNGPNRSCDFKSIVQTVGRRIETHLQSHPEDVLPLQRVAGRLASASSSVDDESASTAFNGARYPTDVGFTPSTKDFFRAVLHDVVAVMGGEGSREAAVEVEPCEVRFDCARDCVDGANVVVAVAEAVLQLLQSQFTKNVEAQKRTRETTEAKAVPRAVEDQKRPNPRIVPELRLTATRLANDIGGLIDEKWRLNGACGYRDEGRARAKELLERFEETADIEALHHVKETLEEQLEKLRATQSL